MRFGYQRVDTSRGAIHRPIVTFTLGKALVQLDGLLDTGARHTIVDSRLAAPAGIVLTGEEDVVPVGGQSLRVVRQEGVVLNLAGHQCLGMVLFADSWEQPFQLLGLAPVLEQLVITFDGPRRLVSIAAA